MSNCDESHSICFNGKEHEQFVMKNLAKCRYQDVYHFALIYCLGINADTRTHIDNIYDFTSGCVKPNCLTEGWITSGSARVVRLAFNLYCNATPSIDIYETEEDKIRECEQYSVEDIFCCGYATYFWEAIKIRYPEYCN